MPLCKAAGELPLPGAVGSTEGAPVLEVEASSTDRLLSFPAVCVLQRRGNRYCSSQWCLPRYRSGVVNEELAQKFLITHFV